jgi:S1-C subfamily serine protease
VGKGLVVTNAHVVAGLKRPQVVDGKKTYVSVPVWFDPNLDIAILKVTGLPDAPLVLSTNTLPNASAAATLGFPGGGSLVAQDGVIIDHVTAVGRNIYNRGVVSRDVYEIQASVQPGDSGGPLVAPDGTVAGVIFARSVSQSDIGYGLLIDQVKPIIDQARSHGAVDTSFCAP